ncbi:hypothetical protein GCM10023107_34850 [Actinoplanes octamycinicus]|nr:hypothetical protein Aoc01nite_28070 [Actinoplanes octamycinicus]
MSLSSQDRPPQNQPVLNALHRVAEVMSQHYAGGRRHLLTEDVLRFAMIAVLEEHGISPDRLSIEVPLLGATRGKLDLVVDRDIAIEFKFPRDPASEVGAADTMTLGEMLSDVYRLAALPHSQRLAVWLLHDRLAGYLARAADRYSFEWPTAAGEWLRLPAELPVRLPATAKAALKSLGAAVVEAEAVVYRSASDGVWLVALEVARASTRPVPLGRGDQ